MNSLEKQIIKNQKRNERLVKKTLKKAKVQKGASLEEIKKSLLTYAKNVKDIYVLRFDEELMKDPNFILGLCKANSGFISNYRYRVKENFQDNIDFMVDFVKLIYYRDRYENERFNFYCLVDALQDYKIAMSNPEFVVKIAEEFPQTNIVELLNKSLFGYSDYRLMHNGADLETYKKCLSGLPLELLCKQAKEFGWKYLELIPKDIPNYYKIVRAGIEKDGFKSLCQLGFSKLLKNKNLIVRAYKKDGIDGLTNFLTKTLSPRRERWCDCDHYFVYDKKYQDLQDKLKNDKTIMEIYRNENKADDIKHIGSATKYCPHCAEILK